LYGEYIINIKVITRKGGKMIVSFFDGIKIPSRELSETLYSYWIGIISLKNYKERWGEVLKYEKGGIKKYPQKFFQCNFVEEQYKFLSGEYRKIYDIFENSSKKFTHAHILIEEIIEIKPAKKHICNMLSYEEFPFIFFTKMPWYLQSFLEVSDKLIIDISRMQRTLVYSESFLQ